MKYKVTPRGWIVFISAGLLVIYTMFSLFQYLTPKDEDDVNANLDSNNISVPQDKLNLDDQSTEDEIISDDVSEDTDTDTDIDEGADTDVEEGTDTDVDESTDTDVDESTDTDVDEGTDTDVDHDSSESNGDSSNEDSKGNNLENEDDIPLSQIDTFYFDKNVATFREENKVILENWILWLSSDESLMISIEGHINGYPKYDDNYYGLSISNNRALVIKNYLVEAGIDETRIVLINMGSSVQVIKTDDLSQHYLNRRAIIYFNNP